MSTEPDLPGDPTTVAVEDALEWASLAVKWADAEIHPSDDADGREQPVA